MNLKSIWSYTTCGSCYQVRRTHSVEVPREGCLALPRICKCGTTDPVYEDTDKFRPAFTRICIGYITWVPCPLHPCKHSPSFVTSANGAGSLMRDDMTIGSADATKCLCSIDAQIELDPKLVEQRDYWFHERDKTW